MAAGMLTGPELARLVSTRARVLSTSSRVSSSSSPLQSSSTAPVWKSTFPCAAADANRWEPSSGVGELVPSASASVVGLGHAARDLSRQNLPRLARPAAVSVERRVVVRGHERPHHDGVRPRTRPLPEIRA